MIPTPKMQKITQGLRRRWRDLDGLGDLHQAFGRLPAGPSQMHVQRLRQWATFPPGETEEDLPSPTYLTLCKDM